MLLIAAAAGLIGCARSDSSSNEVVVPRAELAPQNPRTLEAAPTRHLLITAEVSDGGLRVVSTQVVEDALPIDRAPELAPMRVRLEDAAGETLFVGSVDGATGVRGEFHGEGDQIEGHHFEGPSLVTIRTPVIDEARTIRLFARGGVAPHAEQGKPAPADGLVSLGSAALPAAEVRQ